MADKTAAVDPSRQNVRDIIQRSKRMFDKQQLMLPLWQELADYYHPQRAEFTSTRINSAEYAQHIFESTPVQHRRDFALAMGAILRPPGKNWFDPRAREQWRNTERAIGWFNNVRDTMRAYLYDEKSLFQRAMRESDDDYCTFGNSVVGITETELRNNLKFRCFHLRNCAFAENSDGEVDMLNRKEEFTLRTLRDTFGEKALRSGDAQILKDAPVTTKRTILISTMPVEMCVDDDVSTKAKRLKGVSPGSNGYVTLYVDEDEEKVLRADLYPVFPYWVRRWELTEGNPYATSPPAMVGLPEARMMQALSQITLEAAEKQLDPPVIATKDALLEGPNLFAGGVSWIDMEYDEKKGEAMRVLDLGKNAGIGLDMRQDIRATHAGVWHINKLSLPLQAGMTAYEASQRIDEYIRTIGPVMEPEERNNQKLLDIVFQLMMLLNAFGTEEVLAQTVPPELYDADIRFSFETPIQQAFERQKMIAANEMLGFANQVATVTQNMEILDNIEGDAMVREGAMILGGEESWLKVPDLVIEDRLMRAEKAAALEAKADQAAQMQMIGQGLEMVPAMANADAVLSQILGPDWVQGLLGGMGLGGQQQGSGRLLPAPGEMEMEEEQMVLPPEPGMGSPMPQGFQGRMPPQQQQMAPQPQAMPQMAPQGGGDEFLSVMRELKDAIRMMAAPKELIKQGGRTIAVPVLDMAAETN